MRVHSISVPFASSDTFQSAGFVVPSHGPRRLLGRELCATRASLGVRNAAAGPSLAGCAAALLALKPGAYSSQLSIWSGARVKEMIEACAVEF